MIDKKASNLPAKVAVVVALATLLFSGCASPGKETSALMATGGSLQGKPAQKGGAQLWAENCLHCHNSRSPSAYSDGEWDVVMHHMRVRANLTADEHRIILAFLKASN